MMATAQEQARGRGRPRDESARRILKAALELMDTMAFAQITVEGIAGTSTGESGLLPK
jgi:AcrR family transcriptional regulator